MTSARDKLELLSIPEIQDLFLEAMQNVVDRAMLDEMVKAIEANDLERLYKVSGFTPAVLTPMLDKLEGVYKQTAAIMVSTWPSRINTETGPQVPIFNFRNVAVEEDLKAFSSGLVTEIDNEVKSVLRTQLSEGMMRGDNPRQTALSIVGRINLQTRKREGGIIGLSSNLANWSNSARNYLEKLDEKYLNLGLRDKRFDGIVKKAILAKKPLNRDQIDKLITSYNNRALKYRADMIARTETLSSMSKAEHISMVSAVNEGLFKPDQVRKYWDSSRDGRTRLSHLYLSNKYNKKNMIPYDEPFQTSEGFYMMHPGDLSLGAPGKEIINCRCRAIYKVDFLKEFT